MGDINIPLLSPGSLEPHSALLNIIDEEEALNLPYTLGTCVTFRYIPQANKFNFMENMSATLDIIHGKLSESEFLKDIEELNDKKVLSPPSFCAKFTATFIFVFFTLIISIVLLMIWAMLILDLVFLVLSIYIIRKTVIFFWIWRVQAIERSYFSKLDKVIGLLNVKYNLKGLNWNIGSYRRWIQLGMLKTEHNVLDDS